MRKRILFQKTVCSLLALLLSLSSLLALPVLAEGEAGAGESSSDSSSDTSSGGGSDSGGSSDSSDSGSGSDSSDNGSAGDSSSSSDSSDSGSAGDSGSSSDASDSSSASDSGSGSDSSDNGTTGDSGSDVSTGGSNDSAGSTETGSGGDTAANPSGDSDSAGDKADSSDRTDSGNDTNDKTSSGDGTNDKTDTGDKQDTPDQTGDKDDGKTAEEDKDKSDADADAGTNGEEDKTDGNADGNPDETGDENKDGVEGEDENKDEDQTRTDEEEKPEGEGLPEELEELIGEEALKKELEKVLPSFLDVANEPVSVKNDTLILRATAAWYLQAPLVFSNDPTKEFVVKVNSPEDCHFLLNWTEVQDSRISIEVTPPMENFIATLYLPLAYLEENGISLTQEDGITFNGQRYSLSGLDLPEAPEPPLPEELPPYEGISIDGSFDDWAGVTKKDLRNPNSSWPCTMQSAVVWDGDYVYIYFHVDDGNANAIGAMGTHSNGQFAITTDLGNIRLVQPDFGSNSVEIYGIDDALVAVDNYNWDPENGHSTEIAIPTSRLPAYKKTISFGYYQVEPFLKDIVNLNPVQGEIEEPTNFACDGTFGEWTYYPHTLIEYDTAGQQDSKVDGGAALHVVDGILYGHVKTAHVDHLSENGSEFLAAIEIAFNGDLAYKDLPEKGNFYPKMVTEDGRTVVNEGVSNPDGITTYLISDTRETTAEPGPYFGTMKIRINGTVDEMEFAIDLAKVAEYIGADANGFQTIHARFGRIGDEWVETAGTPTGPILGLALCFATVGGTFAVDHKKKKKK